MLWYKAWLETRWRFLIGLLLLVASAIGAVMMYPKVLELMPLATSVDVGGEMGRGSTRRWSCRATIAATCGRSGFVRTSCSWGRSSPCCSASAAWSRNAATRSCSRSRCRFPGIASSLFASRSAWPSCFILCVVPQLVIPMVSPAVGQAYAVGDGLVHALCAFVAAGVFFSLAFLLSTVFSDVWRPLLIALGIALALACLELFVDGASRYGVFEVMSAESYFRTGSLPWIGLLLSAAASAALLYAAASNIARRDF